MMQCSANAPEEIAEEILCDPVGCWVVASCVGVVNEVLPQELLEDTEELATLIGVEPPNGTKRDFEVRKGLR